METKTAPPNDPTKNDNLVFVETADGSMIGEPRPPDTPTPQDSTNQQPTKKKSCPARVKSLAKGAYALVKSELGLLLILVVYSMIGAAVFSAIEQPYETQLAREFDNSQHRVVAAILNITGVSGELPVRKNSTNDSALAERGVSSVGSFLNENATSRRNASSVAELLGVLLEDYLDEMRKTRMYGQLETGGMTWTYWGALFFCGTIVTTVGYGNIVAVTPAGRIATMVYALFGIPLCLIVLTKLGQSLTRAIKYFWAFGRRFYYTGSCLRVRRMIPVSRLKLSLCQRIAAGLRRRKELRRSKNSEGDVIVAAAPPDDAYVPYEIDDNFNLPPIVAVLFAFTYTLLGALMYMQWENWNYLDAFYFTFISLCTVGFGDVIPEHPKFFLATSIYLLVGFALIAMVINVVMESVNDTIEKAKDTIEKAKEGVINVGQRMMQSASPPGGLEALMREGEGAAPGGGAGDGRGGMELGPGMGVFRGTRRRSV